MIYLIFYKHVERTVNDIKNQIVIKFLVFKKWISDAKWIWMTCGPKQRKNKEFIFAYQDLFTSHVQLCLNN